MVMKRKPIYATIKMMVPEPVKHVNAMRLIMPSVKRRIPKNWEIFGVASGLEHYKARDPLAFSSVCEACGMGLSSDKDRFCQKCLTILPAAELNDRERSILKIRSNINDKA